MNWTLSKLIAEMDRYHDRVPLERLEHMLENLDLDLNEISDFLRFSDKGYARNLYRQGEAYQALILCWKNGQRSPIHDHKGSSCAFRVLEGTALETAFERTPEGHTYAVGSRQMPRGTICASQDLDIHQISNVQPDGKRLVTLHIYSPPLQAYGIYSIMEPTVRRLQEPIVELVDGAGI